MPQRQFLCQSHLVTILILFDHSTPAPLARHLAGHIVTKAKDRGWDRLSNGDLCGRAERAGFDVLLTADTNMRYQQNLAGRKIALVVLATPQWAGVLLHIDKIAAVLNSSGPGAYTEIEIPYLS